MKTFEYRGYDQAGRAVRGFIEASDVKEAREKLTATGVLADRIAPTGRPLRFQAEARSLFYRELSALLAAGWPLLKAFEVLLQLPELGRTRSLLAGVRDRVREGASLAAALESASSSVTPMERTVIEAAERSAAVETMLRELADHLDERERIRERIRAALIYPALVVAVGILVAAVMLGVLLPRTRDLVAGGALPLPALTRAALGAARWTSRVAPWAGAAAVALIVFVRRQCARSPAAAVAMDRLSFRCPVLGRSRTLLVNQRFARTLGLLLRGGVGPVDAVRMAGRATGSPWVASLAGAASEAVRHGASLSQAVAGIPPLAATLPGRIQVGEASGGLADLLAHAAARDQEAWERYVRRALSLLEPLLILIIGGFVLLVTLSVLLPIISLSRTVAR